MSRCVWCNTGARPPLGSWGLELRQVLPPVAHICSSLCLDTLLTVQTIACVHRCDSINGPAAWPGSSASSHCDALEQSPINLCGAAVYPQAPNLTLAAGYATAQTYKFSADGKAYLDAAGLDLTLDAGNLVCRVAKSARITA